MKKDIAARYGIPSNSLSTILKNRNNVIKQVESSFLGNRKQMKVFIYEEIDKTVFKWMTYVQNNNLPISSTLIKEKVIYFIQQFGFIDFRSIT